MEDLPVIPIVFNEAAYLINDEVMDLNNKTLFWDKAGEYYYPVLFDKIEIKEYEEYEERSSKFIIDNFDSWKENPNSYFALTFGELTVAEFVNTNSYYIHLFKDKDYDFIPEAPTEEKTEKVTEAPTEKVTETETPTEAESESGSETDTTGEES